MATSHDQPYRHYLREWRERRGLLQEQLGQMVGSSKSVISRLETGERPIKIEMQFKLMRALKISPAQFFSPPDRPSLDALVADESLEVRERIAKVVAAFLAADK
jgi:transcriptional regulator with XRE-family HTH domain